MYMKTSVNVLTIYNLKFGLTNTGTNICSGWQPLSYIGTPFSKLTLRLM